MKKTILNIALSLMIAIVPVTYTAAKGLDLPIVNINGQQCYFYKVKSGDTVHGIANKLGISRETLIKYNQWANDGVRPGKKLYFPVIDFDGDEVAEDNNATPQQPAGTRHVVEKDETLFGISYKYGLTPEQIIAANPSAEYGVHAGDILIIPEKGKVAEPINLDGERRLSPVKTEIVRVDTVGETRSSDAIAREETKEYDRGNSATDVNSDKAGNDEASADVTADSDDTPLVVPVDSVADNRSAVNRRHALAVMLPFMLDEEKSSKASAQILEFYRGFLLGIDSLKALAPDADVYVFDTQNRTDVVRDLLAANPQLVEASLIIAPDNSDQLRVLADYGREHGIYVLNNVNARDSLYLSNPYVMQGAVPTPVMYHKAIDGFIDDLGDATPIILNNDNGRRDKQPFIDELKQALLAKGIVPQVINYSGSLHSAAMEEYFGEIPVAAKYVFISNSGSLNEFNKFAPALEKFKTDLEANGGSLSLWGYPEYVTFRNDALESLHKLCAVIYSRSYNDVAGFDTRSVSDSFKKWYGRDLAEGVPSQGILGFDTANFALRMLNGGINRSYPENTDWQGVQSTFRFRQLDNAEGLANTAVFLVIFLPGESVDVRIL